MRRRQWRRGRDTATACSCPYRPFADAFCRGLQAFGKSRGQNIKIEIRYNREFEVPINIKSAKHLARRFHRHCWPR